MSSVKLPQRVVIVDDSRTVQAMLDNAFSQRIDFRVVGFASDATVAVEMIRRLLPDIVTIDLCMPYLDGAALLEMISDLPTVCKIIVSDNSVANVRLTSKLMASGASLCIAKSDIIRDPARFFKKINAAAQQLAEAKRNPLRSIGLPASMSGAVVQDIYAQPIVAFPVPADESARIDFVRGNGLANARRERRFDVITKHVAKVTAFPACLLTIIDRDTQWIMSTYGLDIESTPRHQAFCNYTISQGGVFAVSNAAADDRFSNNPLVTGSPYIKSYAGHPVINEAGVPIAALCVIDIKVRTVSHHVIDQLTGLSEIVAEMINATVADAA